MCPHPTDLVGFTYPGQAARFQRRRSAMQAELVTSAALVVGTIVAAVAVSMGIAHAEPYGVVADEPLLPVAALFGLVLIGMGSLTALVTASRREIDRRG
jgi:hypothetical protein